MIKTIVKILSLSMLLIALVVVPIIVSKKMSALKYSSISVEITKKSPRYFDEKGILKLIKDSIPKIEEQYVKTLNLNKVEHYLESITAVKKADVYRNIKRNGLNFSAELVAEITQRNPIVRVISNNGHYYIDAEGVRINANQSYTAKVLLISGDTDEKYIAKNLMPLISFIINDEFWKAQIKHIEVSKDGELRMIPLLGEQIIEFGEANRYKEKFRNLKALYEQGFEKLSWDKYKIIDLRYKGQVVCVKK